MEAYQFRDDHHLNPFLNFMMESENKYKNIITNTSFKLGTNAIQVTLNEISNGLYIITFQNGGEKLSKKIQVSGKF